MIDLQTLIACCILAFILGAIFDQAVQWSAVESAQALLDEADEYFDAVVKQATKVIESMREDKNA
jgi:hypothetical protein